MTSLDHITEPEGQIPVVRRVDLVVVGGRQRGCAGRGIDLFTGWLNGRAKGTIRHHDGAGNGEARRQDCKDKSHRRLMSLSA